MFGKVDTTETYQGDKELIIDGYVDASFDTDPDDSKSQFRYTFLLNGGFSCLQQQEQTEFVKVFLYHFQSIN